MTDGMVDKELQRQLAAASPTASVGAVFTLRSPDADRFLSSEETQSLAKRVIAVAAKSSGEKPHAVQVFGNLQSFAVQGSSALVHAIIQQPEIETATANQQPEDVLIPPVERRDVSLKTKARHADREN